MKEATECRHRWKQLIRMSGGHTLLSEKGCEFYCIKCLKIKHLSPSELKAYI